MAETSELIDRGIRAYLQGKIADAQRLFEEALTQLMINTFFYGSTALDRRAPHQTSPELDVHRSEGLRTPHAAVITFGVGIFLWLTAIYAPR